MNETPQESGASAETVPAIPMEPVGGESTAQTSSPAETAEEAADGIDEPDGESPEADADMPPVPESIREAGRLAPDHWLGMVDPAWSGEGAPPEWAVVGQWRSGLDGEIVEWRDNEEYKPSPTALGWPEPQDEVDAAVQLAATGYGSGDDVVSALAKAEVAVLLASGGGPLVATAPDEEKTPVLPVFTSPAYLHMTGRFGFQLMPVAELLEQVPDGCPLYINASAAVSMTVETEALREVLAAADGDGGAMPSRPAVVSGGANAAGSDEAGNPAAPTADEGSRASESPSAG